MATELERGLDAGIRAALQAYSALATADGISARSQAVTIISMLQAHVLCLVDGLSGDPVAFLNDMIEATKIKREGKSDDRPH